VTSYVPTTYAALLARDAYMGAVRIVDGMTAELKVIDNPPGVLPPETPPDDQSGSGSVPGAGRPGNASEPPPQPPKRGRGRPRKYPRHEDQLQMPMGENGKGSDEAD